MQKGAGVFPETKQQRGAEVAGAGNIEVQKRAPPLQYQRLSVPCPFPSLEVTC